MADVRLRAVTDEDVPIFFEQQRDPKSHRMAAFTFRDPEDRDAFDAHWARIRSDPTVTNRTIVSEGTVVGHIACFVHEGNLEVTYWVGPEQWGKGYASAALKAFLEEVPDRPLYAAAAKDNIASIRVLERAGFRVVGEGRALSNARGEEIDEVRLRLD